MTQLIADQRNIEARCEFLKKDYVRGFPAYCGFRAERAAFGVFESRLTVRPEHQQQDGFVHAGVLATLADHTAGYAAYTTVSEDVRILTIEFKINYFRPAVGNAVVCRSKVVHRGRTVMVSESELFAISDMGEKPVSKATVTLMGVPASGLK